MEIIQFISEEPFSFSLCFLNKNNKTLGGALGWRELIVGQVGLWSERIPRAWTRRRPLDKSPWFYYISVTICKIDGYKLVFSEDDRSNALDLHEGQSGVKYPRSQQAGHWIWDMWAGIGYHVMRIKS